MAGELCHSRPAGARRPGRARRASSAAFGVLRALVLLIFASHGSELPAQADEQGAQTPREAAPMQITGYWVSVVSEDWRVRMTMGQKGDWEFIDLSEAGVRAAEEADPADEDACKAYGAPGIMRIPTRLHVTWRDDATLRIDTDAGMQSRLLHFDNPTPPREIEPTRQGRSRAEWRRGEMTVVTTSMLPGYYFKHGVPYSGDAVMTEHVALLPDDHGEDYLLFTTVVEDPHYLDGPYIRTLTFKREADGAAWNPSPCRVP